MRNDVAKTLTKDQRLQKQLDFLIEIDRLKSVLRKTRLFDGSRAENSAEHSWHITMMALILAEYAATEINVGRVIKMMIVHDIAEIDSGDMFYYNAIHSEEYQEKERKCAEEIFGLLPDEQAEELHALWLEFEEKQTNDAKFAAVLDRLSPNLQNLLNGGGTWLEFKITLEHAIQKHLHLPAASPVLGEMIIENLERAGRENMMYVPDSDSPDTGTPDTKPDAAE